MKKLLLFLFLLSTLSTVNCQTIWDGPDLEFEKPGGANWALEINQDRITDQVWITRRDNQGIFNIAVENLYENFVSPMDTEWAMGTTLEIDDLTFTDWKTAVDENPSGSLNQDMVLHLITEDIYIDIQITGWGQGDIGGGFAYTRSTDPSLSIQNLKEVQMSIIPNPSSDSFEIYGIQKNVDITVLDITGREVLNMPYSGKINVTTWPKGLYIVQIMGVGTTKFVKK